MTLLRALVADFAAGGGAAVGVDIGSNPGEVGLSIPVADFLALLPAD